jgi:hypothetical protein
MSLMLRRVALVMLSLSLATGPQILCQNDKARADAESSEDPTPIHIKSKSGYANNDGKIVIKPQFKRADKFSEGLALVWTEGVALEDPVVTSFVKMGYIDAKGNWIIQSRFKYFFFDDFSDGVVPFRQQSSKWGYMDKAGKIVIQPQFDWGGDFSVGIASVLTNGRCAHIDKTGTITDQSQTVLPRKKYGQDRHGTYQVKPQAPPCS